MTITSTTTPNKNRFMASPRKSIYFWARQGSPKLSAGRTPRRIGRKMNSNISSNSNFANPIEIKVNPIAKHIVEEPFTMTAPNAVATDSSESDLVPPNESSQKESHSHSHSHSHSESELELELELESESIVPTDGSFVVSIDSSMNPDSPIAKPRQLLSVLIDDRDNNFILKQPSLTVKDYVVSATAIQSINDEDEPKPRVEEPPVGKVGVTLRTAPRVFFSDVVEETASAKISVDSVREPDDTDHDTVIDRSDPYLYPVGRTEDDPVLRRRSAPPDSSSDIQGTDDEIVNASDKLKVGLFNGKKKRSLQQKLKVMLLIWIGVWTTCMTELKLKVLILVLIWTGVRIGVCTTYMAEWLEGLAKKKRSLQQKLKVVITIWTGLWTTHLPELKLKVMILILIWTGVWIGVWTIYLPEWLKGLAIAIFMYPGGKTEDGPVLRRRSSPQNSSSVVKGIDAEIGNASDKSKVDMFNGKTKLSLQKLKVLILIWTSVWATHMPEWLGLAIVIYMANFICSKD